MVHCQSWQTQEQKKIPTLFLQSKLAHAPAASFITPQASLSPQTPHSAHTHIEIMTSGCISGCVDAHAPVRATYVNLYKWPESDAEFVKSVARAAAAASTAGSGRSQHHRLPHPRVVDSYSCRQMYLRSYTFSRKETVQERTTKCFGRVRERVVPQEKEKRNGGGGGGGRRKVGRIRRVGEITCAGLCSIFHRLLSCTTSVDVVDRGPTDGQACPTLTFVVKL
ncbi:hypothetical protein ACLOJK_001630 [Asimina triloba]